MSKRQRHVFPNREIPHLWAHQTQEVARNGTGSFYFRGATIYSYDSHFPIATAKEIIHTHTALSEKAVHWRVERILRRLQKAADDLGIKSASSSLPVPSQNPQKRKK